jgi:hypothetical protein
MLIQVSGEYAGSKSRRLIWPIQKNLNDCFKAMLGNSYSDRLAELSIVLRVSGEHFDFGPAGPDRLKGLKGGVEVTIDLVIARTSWSGTSGEDLMGFVVAGVRECLNLMIAWAQEADDDLDGKRLNADIELALACAEARY